MPPDGSYPPQDELVGYAMDGFAIYGPLSNGAVSRQGLSLVLDECNGLVGDDGVYRYHMIRIEDLDFTAPMCNEQDPRVHNWKPIIGCFRGSTTNSKVWLDDGNREGMTCQTILDGGAPSSTTEPEVEQPSSLQETQNLITCLEAISNTVVIDANDGATYAAASQCHNSARIDRVWSPKAIIKVYTAEQVAEAVKCAAASSVKVTPRSGGHGFENEGCSGELIIDVSGLESLEVVGDSSSRIVAFGSGHLHGQLYIKLSEQYGWVVPGGTENSVGTAGLWLGCGRGPLAQVYGFTCDNVLGVEFVDADGNIRVADDSQNTDMYWMARGSGGEFPGIVTKFTVQAYDQPSEVWNKKILFQSSQLPQLIQAWSNRIEAISNPVQSMFTSMVGFKGAPILSMTCFSCDSSQKEFMQQQFDEITEAAGGGYGYNEWIGTWQENLLREDWDGYDTVDDLASKPEWPEVWATLSNGGHLVYDETETNDAMLSVLQSALENYGDDFYLYLYSMISGSSNTLQDTALGARGAKYIVHYKWIGSDTNLVKANQREISIALDEAGLQCKNFYNYGDRSFPCAEGSGQAWLEAHFSDVDRMRTIRESEDPNQLFVSNFKMQKWDTNQYSYVGMPEVGGWGGTCTCPNGSVFRVGNTSDACGSLACVGGVAGACSENNAGGEGNQVICDTSIQATTSPTSANASNPEISQTKVPAPAVAPSSPVAAPVSSPVGPTADGDGTKVPTSSSAPSQTFLDNVNDPASPPTGQPAPLAFLPPSLIASQIESSTAERRLSNLGNMLLSLSLAFGSITLLLT
jgi:FAD/FMN-containing dehydrogenase